MTAACSLTWDPDEHRGGGNGGSGNLGGQYLDGSSGSAGTSGAGGSGGGVDAGADSACGAGTADCISMIPGCETNVETDPVHCGQCGHDCMGAGCQDGMCQPQLLGAFEGQAAATQHGIMCAIADGTLYALKFASAANGGGLYEVPEAATLTFGKATRTQALDSPIDIVALPNGQVVTTGSATYAIGATPLTLLSGGAWGMTNVGGQLRIAAGGMLNTFTTNEVDAMLAGGTAPAPVSQPFDALDITDTGQDVCWTDPAGKQVSCLSTWSGTSVAVPDEPHTIVSDGQSLYWTERPPGTSASRGVKTASLSNKPNYVQLIGGYEQGNGLALDSTFLYAALVSPVDGVIARVPKTGGPAQVLASGLNFPFGVAVDPTFVYFTSADGIYRVRMPE